MSRDPVTGQVSQDLDLSELRAGDRITVVIDDMSQPNLWDITIISVDPVLLFKPREVWITGIYREVRCRVLVRANLPVTTLSEHALTQKPPRP